MTDWQEEFKTNGWLVKDGKCSFLPYIVGENGPSLKLEAEAVGEFVVMTLFVCGQKTISRRAAIEDAGRVGELMTNDLSTMWHGIKTLRDKLCPVTTRSR